MATYSSKAAFVIPDTKVDYVQIDSLVIVNNFNTFFFAFRLL